MPWYLAYMSERGPHADSTPFSQSWTLGIEEKFYFSAWCCSSSPCCSTCSLRVRLGVVVALVLVPILTLPLGLSPSRQEIVFTAYGRILIGCLIAICLHEARLYQRLRFLGRHAWSLVVVVLFVGSLLLVEAWHSNWSTYAFPFAAALLLISLTIGDGVGSKVLSRCDPCATSGRAPTASICSTASPTARPGT